MYLDEVLYCGEEPYLFSSNNKTNSLWDRIKSGLLQVPDNEYIKIEGWLHRVYF